MRTPQKNDPLPLTTITCMHQAVTKAFSMGRLTKNAMFKVWGIGSNQGSWSRFSNIEVRNPHNSRSIDTMRDLAFLTTVHNEKQANYMGKPSKFCLTHKDDEITEVSNYFGILDILEETISIVDKHDEMMNLKEERKHGGIADWERRTISIEVPFVDMQNHIFDHVMSNLMQETTFFQYSGTAQDREYLLANAFIEGLNGLTLGSTDLDDLMQGNTVTAKYFKAS